MEFTGKLSGLDIDYMSGSQKIAIQANEDVRKEFDRLKNCDKLSVKIVKYRKKRSLDANAYFHVLNGKIAEVLNISKQKSKNILIARYGQYELLEDEEPIVYKTNAPVEYMLELENVHFFPCGSTYENGKELIFYHVYRGSHTYDSYEMSKLIEGTVSEAKELGIETATPEELKAMEEKWRVKFEKRITE